MLQAKTDDFLLNYYVLDKNGHVRFVQTVKDPAQCALVALTIAKSLFP